MAMLCGNKSFNLVDDHDSCKKKQSSSSSSQNPFSASGLDKFEKVLQELDRKKAKVLLRAKSHGDASVRFTYKLESEDWIPIIIRKSEAKEAEVRPAKASGPRKRLSAPPSLRVERGSGGGVVNKMRRVVSWELGRSYAWRGGQCWALVIIVTLVVASLMIGRSFAICWATVSWYLAPLVSGGSSGLRGRELGRGVSGKRLRRKELGRGVSGKSLEGKS